MSLVNLAISSIVIALNATPFNVDYMTSNDEALIANQHIALSNTLYQQGDFSKAVKEFYSAYSPTVEEDEIKVVTEYVDNLVNPGKIVNAGVHDLAYVQCLVFAVCKDDVKDQVQEQSMEIRGGQGAQDEIDIQKRALRWVFHNEHQAARIFVQDLSHAFASHYFGTTLRGSFIRVYGYHGAYLSWHHDMSPWSSATAVNLVNDCLAASHGASYISARVAASSPAAAEYFCVSNRPIGC